MNMWHAMPRESGIYRIVCLTNGKVYVGSASNLYNRAKEHLSGLRRGVHHTRRLQRAWNRYGEPAFSIEVIATCEKAELLSREQVAMDLAKAADPQHGFNALPLAGSRAGMTHSPEARRRISEATAGRTLAEEHKARIGDLHRGRKRTPETCGRIRQANLGKRLSPEHRLKISDGLRRRSAAKPPPAPKPKAPRQRRSHSEETRAKLRAAALKRFENPKERQRVAENSRGKKLSPEHIAALRAGHAAHFASKKIGVPAHEGLCHPPDQSG